MSGARGNSLHEEIMALEPENSDSSYSLMTIAFEDGFDTCKHEAAELAKIHTEIDTEAVAWAIKKLEAFGVASNTMDNALMVDRLFAMIK